MKHSTEEHTFQSGLKLLLIDLPNAASLDVRVFIRSGYGYAPADRYELPHVLEHMIFGGNELISDSAVFTATMETMTATWRGLTNFRHNYFTYSKSPRQLDDFLNLVYYQIFKPVFTEQDLTAQKGVIRQELEKQLNGDSECCAVESLKKALPVKSLRDRLDTLNAISLQDVNSYHEQMFQPDNTCISISGDLSQIKPTIILAFDKWAGTASVVPEASYIPLDTERITIQSSFRSGRSFVQLDMLKFGFHPEDMPAIRALQAIWHTSKSSRFYQVVRPQGHSYSPIVSVALTHSYLRLILQDSLPDDNLLGFLESMMSEYYDIAANGPTEDELERAKKLLLERDTINYSTPQQLGEYYAEHRALGEEPLSVDDFNKALTQLTTADIQRIASEYSKNWHIVIRTGIPEPKWNSLKSKIEFILKNYK